jgi:hypothetical protein
MSKIGNKCAQVKRLLNAEKPVTGDLLDFALSLLPDPRPDDKYGELWSGIARNLKAGEPLRGYEHHVMVEVVLLHFRLQAATAERLQSGA